MNGDVNINVAMLAANCIEAIARGLRRSFAAYKSIVFHDTARSFCAPG